MIAKKERLRCAPERSPTTLFPGVRMHVTAWCYGFHVELLTIPYAHRTVCSSFRLQFLCDLRQ